MGLLKHHAEHHGEECDIGSYVAALLEILDRKVSPPDVPLKMKASERALFVMRGVGLFEPRSEGGHWVGRSSGISVPVGNTRMRLRVGASKGHYVRAPEEPTVIDSGDATITDQRVVFQGARQVREWQMAKLIGFTHDHARCATAIQVENRQKVSGLVYKGIPPEKVQLALDIATAVSEGKEADARAELFAMLPPRATPPAPTPGPTAVPATQPAAWRLDPSGRHQYRYWDGREWTAHVADNGESVEDPLP